MLSTMVTSKDLNEWYIKWVLIIAIVLISLGTVSLFVYPDNTFLTIIATAFIQLGITLFVVDLVIKSIGSRLLQRQVMIGFRKILGIENPNSKLFPELISLMRPHPYHVLSIDVENRMVYDINPKRNSFNMGIIEKTIVVVQAKEENVNYHFYRGSDDAELSRFKLKKIELDGESLDPQKDLIITENPDTEVKEYLVKYKLKKDQTYKFELVYEHPPCMSDLNNNEVKEDYFMHRFIELTNKAKLRFIFPFDVEDYIFMARRIDASHREELIKFKKGKKDILLEQENLDNGVVIKLGYKKDR